MFNTNNINASNNNPSAAEIRAIVDTYEGMIALDWNNSELRNQRTTWLARLAEVEGR